MIKSEFIGFRLEASLKNSLADIPGGITVNMTRAVKDYIAKSVGADAKKSHVSLSHPLYSDLIKIIQGMGDYKATMYYILSNARYSEIGVLFDVIRRVDVDIKRLKRMVIDRRNLD